MTIHIVITFSYKCNIISPFIDLTKNIYWVLTHGIMQQTFNQMVGGWINNNERDSKYMKYFYIQRLSLQAIDRRSLKGIPKLLIERSAEAEDSFI